MKYIEEKLQAYSLRQAEQIGHFRKERAIREEILEVLLREERQYCNGTPWQEDPEFISSHWDALRNIFFADSVTLSMLDSFRSGLYFKISPDSILKNEIETTFGNNSSTQKRISL
jgi:hypothetical protein